MPYVFTKVLTIFILYSNRNLAINFQFQFQNTCKLKLNIKIKCAYFDIETGVIEIFIIPVWLIKLVARGFQYIVQITLFQLQF